MWLNLLLLIVSFLCATPAMADVVAKPYTFSAGTTIESAKVNSDFDTLYNDYNGNISNANIKSAAAIALSKLAQTSNLFILMSTGNNTVSSGVTGDTVPRITMRSSGELMFGPGSSTALDIQIKRVSPTQLAVRNIADSAYLSWACDALTLNTPLTVANGGIGAATLTAYNVLLGNGTSAVAFAAPGTAGLPLLSNGAAANPTFSGPVSIAGGGTNNASFSATAGNVPYADGSKLTTVGATANKYIRWNSGGTAIEAGKALEFGGQGERTAPTNGTLTGEYWNSGNWTPDGAITCNRCRIHVRGNVTLNQAITVATEAAGGAASIDTIGGGNGSGPGGGSAGVGSVYGGGGGANGGAGGDGGSSLGAGRKTIGARAYFLENYLGGSSGGAGSGDGSSLGGVGGAAGGSFYLEVSGTLNIQTGGTITATGGAGAAGASNMGGGGGGSGGSIDVRCYGTITVENNVTWSAVGGAGGAGGTGGGGGGGGGGNISVKSGTITETGTLTLTVSGGAAGTGSATQAASAGATGTSDKTAALYGPRSSN